MGDANMGSHEFEGGQDGNRGKGGTTHGFAMKDVGAPPPELPGIDPGIGKVIGPTKAEAEAANAGEYALTGVARVLTEVARRWKALVAAGLAIGGSVAAYEMNPGLHQLVDDQFLERIGVNTKEIGPTFDNKVKELIGENNISFIPKEQLKTQSSFEPTFNKETKTLEYLLPFKLPKGVTASLDKTPRLRGGVNAEAEGINETPTIKFSDKGVEVFAPADSHMELYGGSELTGVDPSLADRLAFYHYDPVQNETIVWSFYSTIDGKMAGFVPLQPMLDWKDAKIGGKNWQAKLPKVEAGTSAMVTNNPNQIIGFSVNVYEGTTVANGLEVNPFTLLTTDSNGKLAVIPITTPTQEKIASVK